MLIIPSHCAILSPEVSVIDSFDAFQGGVEYGGLRSRNEIRILICYLLSRVGEPLSIKQLTECLSGIGLVNYFEISEAADYLLSSGAVGAVPYHGEECMSVAESGREIAGALEQNLTRSVREKAVGAALTLLSRARSERENAVTVEKREGGYFITFVMTGFSEEILRLTLFAADGMQAQMLKDGFLNDPAGFYTSVIDKLIKKENDRG